MISNKKRKKSLFVPTSPGQENILHLYENNMYSDETYYAKSFTFSYKQHSTFNAPNTTAADDILNFFFFLS